MLDVIVSFLDLSQPVLMRPVCQLHFATGVPIFFLVLSLNLKLRVYMQSVFSTKLLNPMFHQVK